MSQLDLMMGRDGRDEGGGGRSGRRDVRRRRRRQQARRRRNLVSFLVVLVVLGGVAGAGWWGYGEVRERFGPPPDFAAASGPDIEFEVEQGDTASHIGRRLQEQGVVRSVKAFVEAAQAEPKSTSIQPGIYRLRAQLPAAVAVQMLIDPANRIGGQLSVPEGLSNAKLVEFLVEKELFEKAELDAALKEVDGLGLPEYAEGRPEGFLYPSGYVVSSKSTPAELFKQMVLEYRTVTDEIDLEERAAAIGDKGIEGDPYKILIIASLVQAEARHEEDMGKVARVIYNRLAKNDRLQFDSTLNYLKSDPELKLTTEDLQVDSPYNSYKVRGLPPGPINNPSVQALEAALAPPPGDWYFFVTTDPETGETKFTADYDEFLKFKAEFDRNRKR